MFDSLKRYVWKTFKAYYFKSKNPTQLARLSAIKFEDVRNIPPQNAHEIGIVVPELAPYGGGITSVFRLGNGLAKRGFSVTYVTYGGQNAKQLKKNAELISEGFSGNVLTWGEGKKKTYDIVIATDCMSVYYAVELSGYKCFFVQDYEPYFYEGGDNYLLAYEAYKMGFHMICLGSWCKETILRNISSDLRVDTVSFPYEPKEYWDIKRDYASYASKKEFKLCVYIRQTPRRLPFFCQHIAGALKKLFAKDGKNLEVLYYGEDKIFKYLNGKCLGKLSKSELNNLYASCDFGMVASFTNISLVPYEMMATGLPIIEFKAGSFRHFFGDEDAFLYDFDCDTLYSQIKAAIESPEILQSRNDRIQEKLKHMHWQNTIDEFVCILKNISNKSNSD